MQGTPNCPNNITQLLNQLVSQAKKQQDKGRVADYIPALARVENNQVGLALMTNDGQMHSAGDAHTAFSIQSISKVFALVMAMNRMGDPLWQRVHMEPSGQAFNSIVQLEWEKGIPRNPVINAGAIVIADVLVQQYSSSNLAFINFMRQLSQTDAIFVDDAVYRSEKVHGHRNAAMAYLMKDFDNIVSEVPAVLDHYFFQCALAMNCEQLVRSLAFLANKGVDPISGEKVCSRRDAHRVNAILSTSGMYDQSGEFAFTVGLPAKSGVGGGIVAVVPNFGVIAAWSPGLNSFGNSTLGMQMVTRLAEELGLSVY